MEFQSHPDGFANPRLDSKNTLTQNPQFSKSLSHARADCALGVRDPPHRTSAMRGAVWPSHSSI